MHPRRVLPRWLLPLWLLAFTLVPANINAAPADSPADHRAYSTPLTLEDRVACQTTIEEVYWRHRIWPAENPGPKPILATVLSAAAIRARVEDGLRQSSALSVYWGRPLTDEQLQAELDRMARESKQPEVLQELFQALDWVRVASVVWPKAPYEDWWATAAPALAATMDSPAHGYQLPGIQVAACSDNSWPTTPAPSATWYFAEGYTGTGFDEYLTMQNPDSTAGSASVTYMLASGAPVTRSYPLPATSRVTLKINDEVGAGQAVSMKVESSYPIVAERPMYFSYGPGWTGGHVVMGYAP